MPEHVSPPTESSNWRKLLVLVAFTVITVTQAVITVMRGGDRQSTFPYGPALAVGFLLAATL